MPFENLSVDDRLALVRLNQKRLSFDLWQQFPNWYRVHPTGHRSREPHSEAATKPQGTGQNRYYERCDYLNETPSTKNHASLG